MLLPTTIKQFYDGDENNESASSSVYNFTVLKGTQAAVSFEDTADIEKTYGDSLFTLPTVSGGSGTGGTATEAVMKMLPRFRAIP